jgi:glycosyl-4,4'-diaponeurosporenoate acyltransferase
MILALIAINTVGWLVLQLSIAAAATRMSSRYFANEGGVYRVREWEIGVYRRWLHIRRWKGMLPDGAPWVGGSFRKKRFERRDAEYLRQFALETRRGEAAHWLMLACFPIFFLWNPPKVWIVLALYAAGANLPCIAVQRYNRAVVMKLLARAKATAKKR